MIKKDRFKMKMARREWQRLVNTAVSKSLVKTLTEPITNSDTSYKRKLDIPMSSGLVDFALTIPKGTKFDLSVFKNKIANPKLHREIQIHIYAAKQNGRLGRTCEVVDHAEGLTPDKLRGAFESFADDKSIISDGRPGRSLFGRGVSDVLLAHLPGEFFSYRDGKLTSLKFSHDEKEQEPSVNVTVDDGPAVKDLADLHLSKASTGTCVRFVLSNDCTIPGEGTIVPFLSQFYMLRLINSDPNVSIRCIRYRSGGNVVDERLEYDFPIGDVIEKFSFTIDNPLPEKKDVKLTVEGIVCRANVKGELPTGADIERRSNGFLVVDSDDAVLDLTLLPEFEAADYLQNIFGIIRVNNIRSIFDWYLNNGKPSPLTVSRDGFDHKHEFTQVLFKELKKVLLPIYRKEEERHRKSVDADLSQETQQKINDAIKELNKYLRKLMGEAPDVVPAEPDKDKQKPVGLIQFIPDKVRLTVGKSRKVNLCLKKDHVKKTGNILYDITNDKIEIKPLTCSVSDGKLSEDYYYYELTLKSDNLHEQGTVSALVESGSETLTAALEVIDVTSMSNIHPPAEIEFRPYECNGLPNRKNNIKLVINQDVIPLDRKIKVELSQVHGAVKLLESSKEVDHLEIKFDKSHIVEGTRTGLILISWRGTGWAQSGTITATVKAPDGSVKMCKGKLYIEQPEEEGGYLRKVIYGPRKNDMCSDLIDGIIYINSDHALNKTVFGPDQKSYDDSISSDNTAQYRAAQIMVEQSVYKIAEMQIIENKKPLDPDAPVSSLRAIIDKETNTIAPKIIKVFMKQ